MYLAWLGLSDVPFKADTRIPCQAMPFCNRADASLCFCCVVCGRKLQPNLRCQGAHLARVWKTELTMNGPPDAPTTARRRPSYSTTVGDMLLSGFLPASHSTLPFMSRPLQTQPYH